MKKSIMIFLGVVIVVLSAMFFAGVVSEQRTIGERTEEYNHGWYYMQDNVKIRISLPLNMALNEEESVTIFNDTIAGNNAGSNIFLRNAIYRPELYLDEVPLYQYEDGGLRRNPPELSYQLCIGTVRDVVERGTLKIVLHKSDNNIITLPMVYVGSAAAIIRMLFFQYAYITVITVTLIMLGFFALLIEFITRKQEYAFKHKLLRLGVFLLIIGVWCLTDSPLFQYLLGYSNINMYVDFFIFMFLLPPFIGFVQSFDGMGSYKALNGLILLSFVNVIVQTVLELQNVFTYIEMVPVTHVLIVAGILTSIILLCREYAVNRKRELFLCLRAFAIAGLFSVFAILMYFLKPELFYQNLLQTGLLLFVLVLLWNIISEFIENLKYKAEANIYKQLAEVDKLTNLKNRRGFDLKMAEIEKNAEKYDNVLLIFIDVNGLKRINDTFGHQKGDETIAAIAGCIRRAYENHGYCYRIGGDEFCAIIENPLFSEEDAISFIDNEVISANRLTTGSTCFSVAVGCSFLREPSGAKKQIAEWKEEADYKMYKNKREKKFRERKE